jgi:hypothetical protein
VLPELEKDRAFLSPIPSATELVLMEDMAFSPRGQAWKDGLEGRGRAHSLRKVAVTDRLPSMMSVAGLVVPESAPDQPWKT